MRLKELAKVSGYSISTVSKALKGCDDIGEKTKIKIRELAEAFNYVPNRYASALRGQKTGVIAIGVPKYELEHYVFYLEGIEEECRNSGRMTMIQQFDAIPSKDVKAISSIRNNSDGVIFLSNRPLQSEYMNEVSKTIRPNKFPTVMHTISPSINCNNQCRAQGQVICQGLIEQIQTEK